MHAESCVLCALHAETFFQLCELVIIALSQGRTASKRWPGFTWQSLCPLHHTASPPYFLPPLSVSLFAALSLSSLLRLCRRGGSQPEPLQMYLWQQATRTAAGWAVS